MVVIWNPLSQPAQMQKLTVRAIISNAGSRVILPCMYVRDTQTPLAACLSHAHYYDRWQGAASLGVSRAFLQRGTLSG